MPKLRIAGSDPEGPAIEVGDDTPTTPLPTAAPESQLLASSAGIPAPRAGEPPLRLADDAPELMARLPNPLNLIPVERRLGQVHDVLEDKSLAGSFQAHVNQQLARDGYIRIGVIDDFRPGETHGTGVEQRIFTNAGSELSGRIVIERYNIGGLSGDERAAVIRQAAEDAQNKNIVALSISGGMDAYSVGSIEQWTGRTLNEANARNAFDTIVEKATATGRMTQDEVEAWRQINLATGRIPVVTPVWNDGNTTLGALLLGSESSNGIVTSIDRGNGSHATEIPGLPDIRMPAQIANGYTSQSAPTFIGQMLDSIDVTLVPTPRPRPTP